MKKYYLFLLMCIPTLNYAAYGEDYIQKSIKNERVYYCFKGGNGSDIKIAFDKLRGRITHFPFKQYNTVKLLKSEKIDDDFPVFKDTYAEFEQDKKIAIFTITAQQNDVWEAEYSYWKTNKKVVLDATGYNLVNLKVSVR